MKAITQALACMLVALTTACLASCSSRPTSTADIPRQLHGSYQVAVAPFMQPTDPSQLVTGQIPSPQGRVPTDALEDLDSALRSLLQRSSSRHYTFITRPELNSDWRRAKSMGQPGALARWVAYGQAHDLEYILVPQILDWHERAGSEAGVTDSAHVRVEFYLINVPRSQLAGRSVYEEKQVGLVDNLFSVADFVKRRGQWVTAPDLAQEGMQKAVEELGL